MKTQKNFVENGEKEKFIKNSFDKNLIKII
jgi:hypothetical protein